MDISRIADFSFKLARAGVLESHAQVVKRHVGRTAYAADGTQDVQLAIGSTIDVLVMFTLAARKKGEEDVSVRAEMKYLGSFQYQGSVDELVDALKNVYLQHVLIAQVFPLAQQSWMRLVQSVGIRPHEQVELGITLTKEGAQQEHEAQERARATT